MDVAGKPAAHSIENGLSPDSIFVRVNLISHRMDVAGRLAAHSMENGLCECSITWHQRLIFRLPNPQTPSRR
jgi:hypothetical protein